MEGKSLLKTHGTSEIESRATVLELTWMALSWGLTFIVTEEDKEAFKGKRKLTALLSRISRNHNVYKYGMIARTSLAAAHYTLVEKEKLFNWASEQLSKRKTKLMEPQLTIVLMKS